MNQPSNPGLLDVGAMALWVVEVKMPVHLYRGNCTDFLSKEGQRLLLSGTQFFHL